MTYSQLSEQEKNQVNQELLEFTNNVLNCSLTVTMWGYWKDARIIITKSFKNKAVNSLHFFLIMLNDKDSVLNKVLDELNVSKNALEDDVKDFINKIIPKVVDEVNCVKGTDVDLVFSIYNAKGFMVSLKDTYISAYAWLLGICERNFKLILPSFQFSHTCYITDILSKYVVFNDFMAKIFELRKGRVIKSQTGDFDDVLENLNKFGVDLTAKAREGKLAPVIGRDEEIQRMIQILVRKTKNNPILLGEPGVGKTAVVEALAQRIARNEVPFSLQNKRLISLDTTALVAGAGVVGELEERMKGVIKEVIQNQEIILFIDEIHAIVGAGAGSKNNNDIANILKPALARGELRTIGATTLKEYRLYFEKDPALQRRFQPVNVNEPSVDEALAMLRGVRDSFELYHNVNITDNALIAAVRLSKRYINDRFLPDKAVDLIDEAAAELKTELESEPNEIARIKRNIQTLKIERKALKMEEPNSKRLDEIETKIANADKELSRLQEQFLNEKSILNEIAQLKLDADTLQKKANLATIAENIKDEMFYSFAMLDKRRELRAKNKEWEKLQKEGETLLKNVVTDENIARIISRWTQIPVQKMLASERQKFLQVEDYLKKVS